MPKKLSNKNLSNALFAVYGVLLILNMVKLANIPWFVLLVPLAVSFVFFLRTRKDEIERS